MQDCMSSSEEKSSWEKQDTFVDRNQYETLFYLQPSWKIITYFSFKGLTSGSPVLSATPFLIAVENNVKQKCMLVQNQVLQEFFLWEADQWMLIPCFALRAFRSPSHISVTSKRPDNVVIFFFSFSSCVAQHMPLDHINCRGWHVDGWLTVTFLMPAV